MTAALLAAKIVTSCAIWALADVAIFVLNH